MDRGEILSGIGFLCYNFGRMIDYYSLPDDILPMSMRVFRRILLQRGWKAEKLCAETLNDLILTRPDGKKIRVASSTPPTTSVFALHLADNKLASYHLLAELGVPQPKTKIVETPEVAREFLEQYQEIVIKPLDGAHGRGVTTGITRLSEVAKAIQEAEKASLTMKKAIMQPQLTSNLQEKRVICINYEFVVAILRTPAHVTGDGRRSVMELIDWENATIRHEPYRGNLAYIDREVAGKYLGGRQTEVPQEGERVQVVASCNVGQGGTAEDCSALIGPRMKEMCENIARVAELPVIGIDFYGDQVIEFNACPSLYYPTGDASAQVAVEKYVDYLEQL